MSHFISANPFIANNPILRDPQIKSYAAIKKYYSEDYNDRETLVVLPTGVGKTGVMAIAPYAVGCKRVLIITPQTIVRNTVMNEINPLNPMNFYLNTEVFNKKGELPTIIEFDKTLTKDVLLMSDIVVLNVHKLQERLESSLLKRVKEDFFDFIIIDEAHHGEARTWKKAVDYFSNAKVLKVTGTPFRSDGEIISGTEIYSYPLSLAMANGYVKSLERFTYLPDKMKFTIKDDDREYSLDEIKQIKDNEWISKSVALSSDCNKSIVLKSIEKLKEKRAITNNNPHKIVAVACSISHAEQIKELYQDEGMKVTVIHSNQDKAEQENAFRLIESHNTDVVVNVALLGEGYDHKFLSIAAIFRPFRSDLPYQQFIGRVLRATSIKDGYEINEEDNIAEVIHHKELNLESLWESYKKELSKSKSIKEIRRQIKQERDINPYSELAELDYGDIDEGDLFHEESDQFLETELFEKRQLKLKESEERIRKIMEQFEVTLDIAKDIDKQINVSKDPDNIKLLRPDLYEKDLRKKLNEHIVEEIIPNIIEDFNLKIDGNEITRIKSNFVDKWQYPPYNESDNNGATLAKYFNNQLRLFLNKPRSEWLIEDYERAEKNVSTLEEYVRGALDSYLL
ncbi:DEAD/DEAH box helicase family protein [Proteiniclasticum sp.]|uniref:DEAD/DEAH box helicase n=1 Tax=Proteiniclasticum sp. TaxID=2053595 RepID=UPI0028A226B9|nr:DEAD/DEAH box helicase family protein [Proteiniclasticum sp.]